MRPSASSISPLVYIREVDPGWDGAMEGGICTVDKYETVDNGCKYFSRNYNLITKSSHTDRYAIDHKI